MQQLVRLFLWQVMTHLVRSCISTRFLHRCYQWNYLRFCSILVKQSQGIGILDIFLCVCSVLLTDSQITLSGWCKMAWTHKTQIRHKYKGFNLLFFAYTLNPFLSERVHIVCPYTVDWILSLSCYSFALHWKVGPKVCRKSPLWTC